jgi:hypothetical protein
MDPGLLCASGTSLAYGLGSVLQASAARSSVPVVGADPRLLLVLARTWRYAAGLALDAVGFGLSVVALRSLPLYVVQSVTASFLAVIALVAVPVLGLRLRRRELFPVAVVVSGLATVGLSAAPQSAQVPGRSIQWLLLGTTVLLVAATALLARRSVGRQAWVLAAVAGLAFGVVAVAARALSASLPALVPDATLGSQLGDDLRALAAEPASYALVTAAPLALVTYAVALQRAPVVPATAHLVLGETLLPALAGVTLLGDHPRPGWGLPAAAGFVLAVVGALALARFGDVDAAVPSRAAVPD